MNKFLLSAALVGSLALGGCATTTGNPPTTSDPLAQAQQIAVAVCGFLPTIQTVQNIIVAGAYPAGIPVAQLANLVGNSICAAVTAKAARAGSVPSVNGVPIDGQWVGKSAKRASYNGVQIHGQWVRP